MEYNLRVINGEREGSRIYHCGDGYYYHYNNDYEYGRHEGDGGEVYLRCKFYTSRACCGKAQVTILPNAETHWTNTQRHTCAPDRRLAEVLALKKAIIEEANQMPHGRYEEPAELVERIRNRFPPDIAAQVTIANMRTAIQAARAAQYPPVPVTLYGLGALLQHRQDITTTLDGRDNFLAGVVETPDTTSIIFMSRRMRRLLARSRMIFCDGTFGSRPNNPDSGQVLQIITVIGNAAVPIGVVLMTGKTEAEYTAVLQHLRQLVPRFNPATVMADFEIGLHNAWKTVFPNVVTLCCYWHYCRAILRKAGELGLIPHMRQDRQLKTLIRSFCAIPLLPQNLIERGVRILMAQAHQRGFLPLLNDFLHYYIDTFMTMPFFGSLSVFEQPHRTNNVAESCNKLLRKKTGAHRPRLWHFVGALRRYEHQSFLALRSAEMGININRGRRVSAITNDMRIANFTGQMFQGLISIRTFLRRASCRVMNVFDEFVPE